MKTVDVLVKAKELIQDPAKWMQGDFTNDDQTCFCGLGAIAQVSSLDYHQVNSSDAGNYLRQAAISLDDYHDPEHSFAQFNDSHSHTEVMQAFNTAIRLAQLAENPSDPLPEGCNSTADY